MPRQISTAGDCLINNAAVAAKNVLYIGYAAGCDPCNIDFHERQWMRRLVYWHWMTRLPKLPLGAPKALVQETVYQLFQKLESGRFSPDAGRRIGRYEAFRAVMCMEGVIRSMAGLASTCVNCWRV